MKLYQVLLWVFMNINSNLDLDNDIKYVKTVINQYSSAYKDIEQNVAAINKKFIARLYFVVFQFRNIFDKSLWL